LNRCRGRRVDRHQSASERDERLLVGRNPGVEHRAAPMKNSAADQ